MWGKVFEFVLVLLGAFVANFALAAPMEFKVYEGRPGCPGCLLLGADGDITEDTPSQFEKFVKNLPINGREVTVVMNSLGGSLIGGLRLGEMIRREGFDTYIAILEVNENKAEADLTNGICASSCAFAFLGGNFRNVYGGGKYGLHQISSNSEQKVTVKQAMSSTQDIIALISKYVESRGVSQEVISLSLKTKANSINWLSYDDLTRLRIVNSNGFSGETSWYVGTAKNMWFAHPLLPDGRRYMLYMGCNEIPSPENKGFLGIGVSHENNNYNASRPPVDLYHELVQRKAHVTLFKNDLPILEQEQSVELWFSYKGEILFNVRSGLKVPFSVLRNALKTDGIFKLKISYDDAIKDYIPVYQYPIPLKYFELALDELAIACPHLKK